MKLRTRLATMFRSSGSAQNDSDRAAASLALSSSAKGSGARSRGRLGAALALTIAAFAFAAAPASAAPTIATPVVSGVSYTTAHVSSQVNPVDGITAYQFQVSTNGTDWTPNAQGFFFNNETLNADLSGLEDGTKYFVRLAANKGFSGVSDPPEVISPGPNPSFTTLVADPPTIPGAVGVSSIFSTSATGTGKVNRPVKSDDVNCRFEYVTDAQFTATGFATATQRSCAQNPITAASVDVNREQEVSAQLGCTNPLVEDPQGKCLKPETTYHLRLVAENVAGVVTKDAASTFTTAAKVAAKPTVLATADATGIGSRSAQASGEIERPAGVDPAFNVECRFEYVTDEQFSATGFEGAGQSPCTQNPVTSPNGNAVSAPVSAELTGLTPDTIYRLRLTAENGAGADSKVAADTFTTPAVVRPTATVDSVTEIGYTSAHATGSVDPGSQSGIGGWQFSVAGKEEWIGYLGFEYLEFEMNPARTLSADIPCINPNICGDAALMPGTSYQVRIAGFDYEENQPFSSGPPYAEFTTKGTDTPATATLNPVTGVTATTAHFAGAVNPNAPAGPLPAEGKAAYRTDWRFECTPECKDVNGNPVGGTVEAEEGVQPVVVDAGGLQPNTFYEIKLITTNGLGTVETAVQTFQTPLIAPTVKANEGASDGRGGYFLEGVVNSNNTKVTSCKFEYGTTATYPNTYEAPCLPNPSGPNEIQLVNVEATEGQFKLSFRGQTTADLPYNATPAEVQTALRALSKIGSTGVNVSGTAGAYKVTFASGGVAGANVEPLKGSDGTTPLGGGAGVSVSTETEGGKANPVSVEAHLEALTVGSTYHFRIFATSAGGTVSTVDRTFIPTLDLPEDCVNEQVRKENSSFALPECRAYEQVSSPFKAGTDASLIEYNDNDGLLYQATAGNIANSGNGEISESYAAVRTGTGWETIPNLNGPAGSPASGPEPFAGQRVGIWPIPAFFSSDFRSSLWYGKKVTDPGPNPEFYLREPDGRFQQVGKAPSRALFHLAGVSAGDLSHLVFNGQSNEEPLSPFGPGVHEWIGTGNGQQLPRRVDVDNSGNPIAECGLNTARSNAIASDGSVIVFTVTCTGEIWARVDGTTSYEVSASHCNRTPVDTGGVCNADSDALFAAATPDGSRVFFTTTQQLVNGDLDETNDLYAYGLPTVGNPNPSPALIEVSGARSGAQVEELVTTSEDGSTVYFLSPTVLADNPDSLGEVAVAGGKNLYVWRQDADHPAGQTKFITRVSGAAGVVGTTPGGRYLILKSNSQLTETDTDTAVDVFRYDAETGEMVRASTSTSGVGGNADGFDADPRVTFTDDGAAIAFSTREPLSSALDGNGESDVYLWRGGKTSLISSGAVSGGGSLASIDGSGRNLYFQTGQALSPSDGDIAVDVYDARVGGGFSAAETPRCVGEACQGAASPQPAAKSPASSVTGPGNPPAARPCPKGKVKKHGKCVKKKSSHGGKKHHPKKHKRAGSNRGGGR